MQYNPDGNATRTPGCVQPCFQVGNQMSVRILIADDHPVVRRGLKSLIGERAGWEVIAEAVDGKEAVEIADRLSPDVVVLDVTMPRMHGLEACRLIRQSLPNCEVLMVTQHDSPQMMREALLCGAKGYVVKSNAPRDLLAAVEAVSQHRNFVLREPETRNTN
jgi:DNA-binding NarL/FixJ family response regulator